MRQARDLRGNVFSESQSCVEAQALTDSREDMIER